MRLEFGAKFRIVEPKEMSNINRRESPRIEIKLRCHVTSPALWMRSAMFTENISRSGLLVEWRGEGSALPMPMIGQILTIEVELPANHGFGQKCIHCQGTVTRISERSGEPASGAAGQLYGFSRLPRSVCGWRKPPSRSPISGWLRARKWKRSVPSSC